MTTWILYAIIAYILFALNGIADKFLLTHVERHPIVFVFYTSITGPFLFLLAPFGLQWLSFSTLIVAIFGGASFAIGLYFLYSATQKTSVSRILPIQGGMIPLFTLVLAYFLLNERLNLIQNIAFLLLVSGAVLMSFKRDNSGWHSKALTEAVIAALLFAISLVLTKFIYIQSNFISGIVWTRLGFFLVAVGILLSKTWRGYIFAAPGKAKAKNIALYYAARLNGGLAGLLQNYAISIGSVTIVNALQGVQFTFLLAMTVILSTYFPNVLKEKITGTILIQKFIAIILITSGLVMLTK